MGQASGRTITTPTGASRHRSRRWLLLVIAVTVLIGLLVGWVWQQSRTAELTYLSWDRAWGIQVEAEFSPVMPTTVTGTSLSTDAGGGVGHLWDNSSAADTAPAQVQARWGRPVSLSFSFIPSCDVGGVADTGVITVSTPNGKRSVPLDLTRLGDAVAGWCSGEFTAEVSSSRAGPDGRDVETVYRLVSPHVVEVRTLSPFWRSEPVSLGAGEEAELVVRSARGCAVNPAKLVLELTYPDGTTVSRRVQAPGDEVCQ